VVEWLERKLRTKFLKMIKLAGGSSTWRRGHYFQYSIFDTFFLVPGRIILLSYWAIIFVPRLWRSTFRGTFYPRADAAGL
jgi:hypothetical protein